MIVFGQEIWHPVEVVNRLGSKPVVVVSMLAILLATLSTNLAANVVSPANGFSNLAPRLISFRFGALMTCVIGVVIMPWKLMDNLGAYIFTWLIGYSALLGPIAGIMICDYFIVRRKRLDVEALYDGRGQYAGVNWVAMVALVLAVIPNIPGFINKVTLSDGTIEAYFPPFWDTIYLYAWFVGFLIAMAVYAAGMFASKETNHQ